MFIEPLSKYDSKLLSRSEMFFDLSVYLAPKGASEVFKLRWSYKHWAPTGLVFRIP